jgi:hypothetical protein
LRKEAIEFELAPQLPCQPAGAPLPRPMKPYLGQADLERIHLCRPHAALLGKQRQGARLARRLIDDLDGPPPGVTLRCADFSQIEDLTLHHASIVESLVLDDVPVDVCLAVLLPANLSQKHGGFIVSKEAFIENGPGLHYRRFQINFKTPTSIYSTTYKARKSALALIHSRICEDE